MSTSQTATTSIDALCINTIRTLAMDAVQKANSGHPGTPMGAAAMVYTLWTRFLRHNPANPAWPNRDRFVLSPGHASLLLYSLLALTGYDLSVDELKQFRQWGSRTPGHPEYGRTPGVEMTTGPLGQGFAMGVGFALAEHFLAAHFNRPGHAIVDHYVYGVCSDGDLMEGISSEAASLAGALGLGKLIYLYDDNGISIEGSTEITFTESVAQRFKAYGWHVCHVDGNDVDAVASAIAEARFETRKPSLIIARTTIAFGSPHKAGTAAAHGSPLGEEEVRLTKEALGWPVEPPFFVPPEALAEFRKALPRGRDLEDEWNQQFEAYAADFPAEARLWRQAMAGEFPSGWESSLPQFERGSDPVSTRVASGKVLNAMAEALPLLMGGSADLAPSTETYLLGHGDVGLHEWVGHNLHFGVREHAMAAITNGLALHGGVSPYCATFLVFCDYLRPALRLAALMQTRAVFIFTHDSIGLGQDGPTHQPIEQLASMRAIPRLSVIRPADANETAAAWRVAATRSGPTALVLSRQNLPVITPPGSDGAAHGAYTLIEASGTRPRMILLATGSEVQLALIARETLEQEGIPTRVVSMPSWDLFEAQSSAYRESVLPPQVRARVAVEAASPFGWERYVGDSGAIVGIDRFGASAPGSVVFREFGFTPDAIAAKAREVLAAVAEAVR